MQRRLQLKGIQDVSLFICFKFLKEKGHAGSIDFLVGYGVFIRGEKVGEDADTMQEADNIGRDGESEFHLPRDERGVAGVVVLVEPAFRAVLSHADVLRDGVSSVEVEREGEDVAFANPRIPRDLNGDADIVVEDVGTLRADMRSGVEVDATSAKVIVLDIDTMGERSPVEVVTEAQRKAPMRVDAVVGRDGNLKGGAETREIGRGIVGEEESAASRKPNCKSPLLGRRAVGEGFFCLDDRGLSRERDSQQKYQDEKELFHDMKGFIYSG